MLGGGEVLEPVDPLRLRLNKLRILSRLAVLIKVVLDRVEEGIAEDDAFRDL